MTYTLIRRILNKNFWIRNRKRALLTVFGISVIGLILILLIGGQQDVGAKEAGHQVEKLAQNIRNRYRNRPDFWGLSTQDVINKKIYPLDMKAENGILTGYFTNPVEIGANKDGNPVMPTIRNFVIAYNDLSKDQCIGLAANRFEPNFWLGVTGITVENDKKKQTFEWSSKEFGLPANKGVLKQVCSAKNNSVIFYFE